MTTNNDQHYIDKVLKGDTNAFGHLVDTYKDMVYSLALKMTKNVEDAEEVSQDAFVKAYSALSGFKGDAKFSTWLYRIVYHTGLDKIKKNTSKRKEVEINEYTGNQIQSVDDVLQHIDRAERSEMMATCLDLLPTDERTVLWLFYFEEKSLKEIIAITAMSSSNLKVKLHRARKRLLEIVKNTVEPELINHYGRSK